MLAGRVRTQREGRPAVDTSVLKNSFALVAPKGPELVEFFYGEIFYRGGPEVTAMFPPMMTSLQDRLLAALVQIITSVDDMDRLADYLAGLGRDHRKFGVQPEHFDLVGQALLATLRHFAGDAWTTEVQETWAAAYALIAKLMQEGAAADDGRPPYWDATVLGREMRGPDIAVIRTRISQPLGCEPGQSVSVQYPARVPRVWRFYSPANPDDGTGLLTFHVKIEDGGLLSTALGVHAKPGDVLRLGPPVGKLRLDTESERDVLLVAGSTGLAPLTAILIELAKRDKPPAVHLFFGAATPADLYHLPALEETAARCDWLTVTHAVTAPAAETPGYTGGHGSIVDVMADHGNWADRDAYVCGSTPMVQAASSRLIALGVPAAQVHVEDFGWEG